MSNDPETPNAETIEAMAAVERGEVKSFATLEELFADLHAIEDDKMTNEPNKLSVDDLQAWTKEKLPAMAEPDWTQQDPSRDQIMNWIRHRVMEGKQLSAEAYGWEAFLYFQRPFHINVCIDMARKIMDEIERDGR